MAPALDVALRTTWLSVWLLWIWSARHEKRPVRSEPVRKRVLAYWIPLTIAGLLLGPGEWFGHGVLRESFVRDSPWIEGIGLGLCVGGAAIAGWARVQLGSNWSAVVQLKHGHELIVRGPYRVVRHPIYTGILLLFVGTALMIGDWRGVLAVGIVTPSLWVKSKQEERWLVEHFADAYRHYQRRTKALIPYVL